MLKKPLLLLVATLLIIFNANSQKNFKEAYVVLKNGDTLRGEIDYRNWEANPVKIQFQNNGSIATYKPNDLISFEIKDADVYVSKAVTKDMQSLKLADLVSSSDPASPPVPDTVFLRRLIKGQFCTLYQLIDVKEHYYIQTGNDPAVEELTYKKFINDGNLGEQDLYKNQLMAVATDANRLNEIIPKVNSCKYEEDELVVIVQLINGSTTQKNENVAQKKINPVIVMAGAGITFVKFKFTGDIDKWTKLPFKENVGATAGFAVDFFGRRNFQKLALRLGFAFTRQPYTSTQNTTDFFGHPVKIDYQLTQNNFTPDIDVLYHFIKKKNLGIYAGIGLGFNFSAYPVNKYTITDLTTGKQSEEEKLEPLSYWGSVNLMAGARIGDKLNINLASNVAGGFIDYNRVHTKMVPLALMVSYVLYSKK